MHNAMRERERATEKGAMGPGGRRSFVRGGRDLAEGGEGGIY